jgi:tRNA threonylcarbamoyl adenosine modification protein YjeE
LFFYELDFLREIVQFTECSISLLEEKAYLLARRITSPTCIFLWGAIGTGKTTFARSFIRSYYNDDSIDVPSPTFTIVQIYTNTKAKMAQKAGDIWHIDLYRIKTIEEILELGLEEAIHHNICLVEWPDKLGSLYIPNRMNIYLSIISENIRAFAILSDSSYS